MSAVLAKKDGASVPRLGRAVGRTLANWSGSSWQVGTLSTLRRTAMNGGGRGIFARWNGPTKRPSPFGVVGVSVGVACRSVLSPGGDRKRFAVFGSNSDARQGGTQEPIRTRDPHPGKKRVQFYYLHPDKYRLHNRRFQVTIGDRDGPLFTAACAFFVVHAPQDFAPHAPRKSASK